MSSFAPFLAIDAKRTTDNIVEYIKGLVDANSAQGVIVGLSGGIDSAVLAALAVRALGKERVHVYYLYDRDSCAQSRHRAELLAKWLDLDLQTADIEPAMCQRQVYAPLIMRIIALAGHANRFMTKVYHIDDMFYSPLLGLYKTQVRQLAAFLGVPSEVLNQPASPDMIKGITDESAIDISYRALDVILDGLERALPEQQMLAAGVTERQISHVRKMKQLSAWKRPSERDRPPDSSLVAR